MRATPTARALSWSVDFLDRWWGPLGLGVVVALEVFSAPASPALRS